MRMSPRERYGSSASIVLSTAAPAGTMIQTTRGAASWLHTSARSFAPLAPNATCGFSAVALLSNTTTCWPPCSSRCTIFPPIRPSPIMASCISDLLSSLHAQRRQLLAQLEGIGIPDRLHAEGAGRLQVALSVVDEDRAFRLRLRHCQRDLVDPKCRLQHTHPAGGEEGDEDVTQPEVLQAITVELGRLVVDRHQAVTSGAGQCPSQIDRLRKGSTLGPHVLLEFLRVE